MNPLPKPEHIRALLIINPGARNGTRLPDLLQAERYLRKQGWELVHTYSEYPGHTRELARAAARRGYNAVIVAGGDGSIGQAADGLAGTDVALGIIPAGTGNILARDLHLPIPSPFMPNAFLEAARLLTDAAWMRVDVGVMTDARGETRRFLNWCGTGFDAAVTTRVEPYPEEKRKWGVAAFVLPAVQTALDYKPPYWNITMQTEEGTEVVEGAFYLAVVNNAQLYAGVLRLAPDAHMDDGWLDISLIRAETLQDFVMKMSALAVLKRPLEPDILVRRVTGVDIETTPVQPVHLDGDPMTKTPIQVRVEPRTLTLMVPSGRRFPRHLFSEPGVLEGAPSLLEEFRRWWT